jgi:rhodanese-related sulfurtransferase
MAAGLVAELGYKNIMIYRDGIPGWAKAGFPINREKAVPKVELPSLNSGQLKELLGNVYVLDVRPEVQYRGGLVFKPEVQYKGSWIKGSYNIPIYQISKRYNEIPMDKKVVVAGDGYKAWNPACWFLKSKGYGNLSFLEGGVDAWEKGGLPIQK